MKHIFCMKQMWNVDKILKITLHNNNMNQPSVWYFPANIQDIWWVGLLGRDWPQVSPPTWSNQTSQSGPRNYFAYTNWTLN